MSPTLIRKEYTQSPTAAAFHADDSFVRGLRGPVGCGKSTACIWEIMIRAQRQRPGPDGVRRTRFAVIRNSYPMLWTTTIKTWKEWFPENLWPIRQNPYMHCHIVQPVVGRDGRADGTTMDTEIIFLAMDQADDTAKLLSLELTGAWINEAREIRRDAFDMVTQRVNRYPNPKLGGISWTGVFLDTNPPDDDSWWYKVFEIERPRGFQQFVYPGALLKMPTKPGEAPQYMPNMHAENIPNLNGGFDYYLKLIVGKDIEWIKVYVLNQYGTLMDGKPVWHEFVDHMHTDTAETKPMRGLPLILGLDAGAESMTPALAICQKMPNGQFRVIDEVVSDPAGTGLREFVQERVRPLLENRYSGMQHYRYGDPALIQRSAHDARTTVEFLKTIGFPVLPAAQTNSFMARREAIAKYMRMTVAGQPGFLVSPRCVVLRKGLLGRYYMRKVVVAGDERFRNEPEKTNESHVCEGMQYAALGLETYGMGGSFEDTPFGDPVSSVPSGEIELAPHHYPTA